MAAGRLLSLQEGSLCPALEPSGMLPSSGTAGVGAVSLVSPSPPVHRKTVTAAGLLQAGDSIQTLQQGDCSTAAGWRVA